MSDEKEMSVEEILAQMEADVAAFRRCASLVECNVDSIVALARRRSPVFHDDEKGARFLAKVMRDLLMDMSDVVAAAIEHGSTGAIDLRDAVLDRPANKMH